MDENQLSFGDIYERFCHKHSHLASHCIDYRPGGYMSINIWFENGMSMTIQYNIQNDSFEIK